MGNLGSSSKSRRKQIKQDDINHTLPQAVAAKPVHNQRYWTVRRKNENIHKSPPSIATNDQLSVDELYRLSLETHLNYETIDELFKCFNQACREEGPQNPVTLDKDSFFRLYCRLREESEHKTRRIADLTFDTLSKDLTGRVCFKDFLVKFVKVTKGNIREKIECTYEIYDVDKKGYVEVSDIKRVIEAMLPKIQTKNSKECETLTRDCMRNLDPNRVGKITKEDFINGLMENFQLRAIMCPYN